MAGITRAVAIDFPLHSTQMFAKPRRRPVLQQTLEIARNEINLDSEPDRVAVESEKVSRQHSLDKGKRN